MKLFDRIRVAVGALSGRDVIGSDMLRYIEKQSASTSTIISYDKAKAPETNYEALVKSGWRRNELIYACVSKKASTASQIALRVVKTGKKQVEIDDHPLRQLLVKPNPHMVESDFWASIIIQQDFAGVAYFEKVRSRAGFTVELWPMRPDWVRPIASKEGELVSYLYCVPNRAPIPFALEDVLPFRMYDPLNQFFGYPPVAVLSRTGDMDNNATDYIRMIFQEGGVPPGILTTTQPINDAVAQRIRAMYREQYGGYKNWGTPMVLGYDTKYQETGLGIDKMGLEVLDARSEVRICLALKVPPVIVGAKIGLERASLSNVREYQRDWWDNDLFPIYKSFADVVREHLLSEYNQPNLDLEWDFDEVPALQEDRDLRRIQALDAFRAGAITRNAFNVEWGYDELGEVGEVYVMSSSLVEVPAALGLAGMEQPEPEPVMVPEEEPEEMEEPEIPEEEEPVKYAVGPSGIKARRDPRLNRIEKSMRNSLKNYFSAQLRRIKRHVAEDSTHKPKIAENTNSAIPANELKQVTPAFWNKEGEILYDLLIYYISDITVRSAKDAFEELIGHVGIGVTWEAVHRDAIQWAEKNTKKVVAEITDTSMSKFTKHFGSWVESGEHLDSLIAKLEPFYGEWRAEMIAVTETTRAYSHGNIEFWKSTSLVTGYDWVHAEDTLVCETCIAMQADSPYALDEEPPPAHVNCRCAIRPVVSL